MGSPFVGEIRMFAGNFAPNGWMFCQGQLLPISQYETLFNLIGTTYGGDGAETFGLPNLASRVPVHMGTLAGGSTYVIGQLSGSETVTLIQNQLPVHSHLPQASKSGGNSANPTNNLWAESATTGTNQYVPFSSNPTLTPMNGNTVPTVGGSQPHDNMVPYLVVNFIISMFGVFPTQN